MIVTNVGMGCGGRGSVLRAMGSQGGLAKGCERSTASGREMLQRTAKSCGPDAPMLAVKFAEFKSAQPGLDKTYPHATVAKEPGHRGEHEGKPLKPLRAGTPGDSGVTRCYSCAFYHTSAHEAAGATGIRRSPRPLCLEGQGSCITRAHRAAGLQSSAERRRCLKFESEATRCAERACSALSPRTSL